MQELLLTLFREGEGFSGKRPFGNSCWQAELEKHFIMNKWIKGNLDEDGYIESSDGKAYYSLIEDLIKSL